MSKSMESKEQELQSEESIEKNEEVNSVDQNFEVEATVAEENVEEAESNDEEVDEKDAKIAELEAKIAEQDVAFLRLRADYDNLARRTRLDREAAEKYRAQSLLSDLLPVIDNLERALESEAGSENPSPLYKGVEMVYRQLLDATKREGLELIEALGQQFDPNVHQAVMQESDSSQPSNIILKELQKGYKLKDRVLRPSMVSVNE